MSIIDWIGQELQPARHTSDSFITIIYRPFDADGRAHRRYRGALLANAHRKDAKSAKEKEVRQAACRF